MEKIKEVLDLNSWKVMGTSAIGMISGTQFPDILVSRMIAIASLIYICLKVFYLYKNKGEK